MKRSGVLLVLLTFITCLSSCGFWNPDPADRLGSLIERESRKLKESEETTSSFDFVPNSRRASTSPRFTGDIVIRVAPQESPNVPGASTILVSEWYWTTYHNNFVRVAEELKAVKKPEEPFRIVLQKTGDLIHWKELN